MSIHLADKTIDLHPAPPKQQMFGPWWRITLYMLGAIAFGCVTTLAVQLAHIQDGHDPNSLLITTIIVTLAVCFVLGATVILWVLIKSAIQRAVFVAIAGRADINARTQFLVNQIGEEIAELRDEFHTVFGRLPDTVQNYGNERFTEGAVVGYGDSGVESSSPHITPSLALVGSSGQYRKPRPRPRPR